jgi:hypothetical protein
VKKVQTLGKQEGVKKVQTLGKQEGIKESSNRHAQLQKIIFSWSAKCRRFAAFKFFVFVFCELLQ